MYHHHLTMGMHWVHGGQVEIERDLQFHPEQIGSMEFSINLIVAIIDKIQRKQYIFFPLQRISIKLRIDI